MKNNQGFTLIELIVVIALMAIIAGLSGGSSLRNVSNQELKDFVKAYDAMLSECKIKTMCGESDLKVELDIQQGEYNATLYRDLNGDGRYGANDDEEIEHQKLKSKKLQFECIDNTQKKTEENTDEESVTEEPKQHQNYKIVVSFDRITGKITVVDVLTNTNILYKLTLLSISNGVKTYSMELILETGYHSIVQ